MKLKDPIMADVHKQYREDWARANAGKVKLALPVAVSARLIGLLIWATCGLAFYTGVWPAEAPEWVAHLSTGLLWLYALLVAGVALLTCVYAVAMAVAMYALCDEVDNKDAGAKETYALHKKTIANAVAARFGTRHLLGLIGLGVRVLLLFGGGAYFVGVLAVAGYAFGAFCRAIAAVSCELAADKIVTPETVAWLEA